MKTNELTGAALDWAVAKCEGRFNEDGDYWADPEGIWYFLTARKNASERLTWTNTSTNWSQGGPIIEREKITLEWTGENWCAYIRHDEEEFGTAPLIAAMRCYVASKLGDEVDVPEELQGETA